MGRGVEKDGISGTDTEPGLTGDGDKKDVQKEASARKNHKKERALQSKSMRGIPRGGAITGERLRRMKDQMDRGLQGGEENLRLDHQNASKLS